MANLEVQRRLAAILAADVAGYTRLMEQDEVGTVKAWRALRSEVIDTGIDAFKGRIVKLTGDGFLAEFPTVETAVDCALTMQIRLTRRTKETRTKSAWTFAWASTLATSMPMMTIFMAMASTLPPGWKAWPSQARCAYRPTYKTRSGTS